MLLVSARPAVADPGWSLRLPSADPIAYRGVVNFDGAGSAQGAMLYPAPSAAGLLVAVLTHGLIVESQKNAQKNALQEAADKVLAPYLSVLDGFTHSELMRKALERRGEGPVPQLIGPSEPKPAGWVVESSPSYAMTQDQRALVLDNSISVHRPGDGATAGYTTTVRVVSQPRAEQDLQLFWTDRNGSALKEESTSLLAHSLELALRDAQGDRPASPAEFKTVRYQEGEAEKMERAQVLAQHCHRQVIRTLRGWLLSVPSRPAAVEPASCEPALPDWK
jgi:hypothetical protein